MAFTGDEDNQISFEQGAELTRRYRESMQEGDRKGGYISKDSILKVLKQDGCVGIRYYYGLNREEKQELVIVGVLENTNDIIGDVAVCLDKCIPCPDDCGENNILNSH